ncbi:site-specific integrase, partial [Bacteroides stercoris]
LRYLKKIFYNSVAELRITFHCLRHSYIFLFTRNKKLTRNKLLDR